MSDTNGNTPLSTEDMISAWRMLTLACRYVAEVRGIDPGVFHRAVAEHLPRVSQHPSLADTERDRLTRIEHLALTYWRNIQGQGANP